MTCKQADYCEITYHEVYDMEIMLFLLIESKALNMQSFGSGFQFRNFVQSFMSNSQGPQERCCLVSSVLIWWELMVKIQVIYVSQ